MLPANVDFEVYQGDTWSKTVTLNATANVTYRNKWSSLYTYAVNDVVQYLGVVYKCILAHTNQTPPNATYWGSLTALNISSATLSAKIKRFPDDSTAAQTITTALVTDGINGKLTLSLTSVQTAALSPGVYYYDLEVTISGVTTKYLKGKITIKREVTV